MAKHKAHEAVQTPEELKRIQELEKKHKKEFGRTFTEVQNEQRAEKVASETVPTVPQEAPQAVKRQPAYFEVAQAPDGLWNWCLWSGGGRCMAMSGQGFTKQNDAMQSIYKMKEIIATNPQSMITYQPPNRKAATNGQ